MKEDLLDGRMSSISRACASDRTIKISASIVTTLGSKPNSDVTTMDPVISKNCDRQHNIAATHRLAHRLQASGVERATVIRLEVGDGDQPVVGVAAAVRRHGPSSLLQTSRTPPGALGKLPGAFSPSTALTR